MRNHMLEVSTPPVVGQNVWSLDASGYSSTDYLTVPAAWQNAVLEFYADGEDFAIAFGGSTLTGVVETNSSSVSSNAITNIGSPCWKVPSGTTVIFDMSRVSAKHKVRLGILASSGTANNELRIRVVDGYVQG